MQDFSTAEPARDFDLIPAGTLAFGILNIRRDKSGNIETQSQSSDGRFLDCEITVCEGPFNKRKIWTKIGVAGSEKWVNMGRSAIRSILEVGKGASAVNAAGYRINDYNDLNTLKVAFEVKIEKGEGSYSAKNEIQAFLTPNTESATSKKFAKLLEMAQRGYISANAGPAEARGAAPWATSTPTPMPQGGSPAPQPTAPPASVKPAWLS